MGVINANPQRRDWFFPIEEVPVLAAVALNGGARNVTVTYEKALVAASTGHIVGIFWASYKVFINERAATLCQKFCFEAFPDATPAEWSFVEGHGLGNRRWAEMDFHQRAHAMNLNDNEGGASETFTPLVRIPGPTKGCSHLKIYRRRWDSLEFYITVMRVAPSSGNR